MNKLLATGCATVALLAGSLALAPSADAAAAHNSTPGCVTKSEYKKIKKGMTKARVAAIFGTKGKITVHSSYGGYVSEIVDYKTCSRYSSVSVLFDKKPGKTLRSSGKSAFWLN